VPPGHPVGSKAAGPMKASIRTPYFKVGMKNNLYRAYAENVDKLGRFF